MDLSTYLRIKYAAYNMPGPTQYVPTRANIVPVNVPVNVPGNVFGSLMDDAIRGADPSNAAKYKKLLDLFNDGVVQQGIVSDAGKVLRKIRK